MTEQTATPEVPEEVKWRGSVYKLVKVEDGRVYWQNPVSRHESSCDIAAWWRSDPYDGKLGFAA